MKANGRTGLPNVVLGALWAVAGCTSVLEGAPGQDGDDVSYTADRPVISIAGQGCDNAECLWIGGAGFGNSCSVYMLFYDDLGRSLGEGFADDPVCADDAITLEIPAAIPTTAPHVDIWVYNADTDQWSARWYSLDLVPWLGADAPPTITAAGLGCDNNECFWITGGNFGDACRVYVLAYDELGFHAGEGFADDVNCQPQEATLYIPSFVAPGAAYAQVWVYDPATDRWSEAYAIRLWW